MSDLHELSAPVTGAEIAFGDRFLESLQSMSATDVKRVMGAVERFTSNPNHPALRLKRLHGDRSGRLHSIRAADDVRVLLWKEGNVFVMLEADPRQRARSNIGTWARP